MSRRNCISRIESLIKKLDDTAITQEQIDKYESYLWDAIDKAMPAFLFKYRSGLKENQLDALKSNKLYLSKPTKFNDPTESMAYIDQDSLVKFTLGLPVDSPLFDPSDQEDADVGYLLKRTEIMNFGISYIQANRERVKICSLSEVVDSPLMWSHYANEHKGFAIRYKTDSLSMPECDDCNGDAKVFCRRPNKSLFPVVYKNNRYDATRVAFARALFLCSADNADNNDENYFPFPLLTVLQKSKDWEYEKEWRIVCNKIDTSYVTAVPDAIFLGERISAELAIKLSKLAHEKSIPLFKMNYDYFSKNFTLSYDDWSEYSEEDIQLFVHEDVPKFG